MTAVFTLATLIWANIGHAEQFDPSEIKFNPIIRDAMKEQVDTHDALMQQIEEILAAQPAEVSDELLLDDTADRLPASESVLPVPIPVAAYDVGPITDIKVTLIPKKTR